MCPEPVSVDHADVTVEVLGGVAVASYSCHSGHVFDDGSRTRSVICLPGGDWHSHVSGCKGE